MLIGLNREANKKSLCSMSSKKMKMEPLFEETLDFSELSCLKGGLDGENGWSIGDHCCSGTGKALGTYCCGSTSDPPPPPQT